MWYVYIIRSLKKRWYYGGSTNRLKERIGEHNKRNVKSTSLHAPFKLVYKKQFEFENEARLYERKVKDCRREKENIIRDIESKL